MTDFLSGALMMGFWTTGLFFWRFWRRTKDTLFMLFAIAFLLLAVERIPLLLMDPADEARSFVHLIRLASFILIAIGILYKNAPSWRK